MIQLFPEIWRLILYHRRRLSIKKGVKIIREIDILHYTIFQNNLDGHKYIFIDYQVLIDKIACGMKLGLRFNKRQNMSWPLYIHGNPVMYATKTIINENNGQLLLG